MSQSRPDLPHGYLGAQSKWNEWNMATVTHNSAEITSNTQTLEIKIKTPKAMKVTSNLIACGSDQEYKDLVFTQTERDMVCLVVAFPDTGYYKLQIYALPSTDDSKTLPNVYNYLLHNTAPPSGPVFNFPKQYAQWKDGCYLWEPFNLKSLNNLDNVHFKVSIPGAKAVALTVDAEWFHFQQGGDGVWQGNIKGLAKFKGKVSKASLNANYGADESKYSSLLEYDL